MSRFEAEKLREVDELKSRFFTNISHEFRTPLTLILGPVKQIAERIEDRKAREELNIVHKNASQLLGLVNQLLDVSKLESGSMKLRTIRRNVIPMLRELVLSFASYAERKRITLQFEPTEDEVIAYVDKEKIEKVMTNVLSNAFKFTPEGGHIRVVAACERGEGNNASTPGSLAVAVSDTGIGIPQEKLPKIFDRFYQVDGTHTRSQEGTGIGLALTKELVNLHKGTISVESEEGKGSTFRVNIPLGKDHLRPEEICDATVDEEEGTGMTTEPFVVEPTRPTNSCLDGLAGDERPLVLIIEDNADVRNYIKRNLGMHYSVLEAVDGEDGWNKSIDHMADLIISDVMMPRMDGFELCRKLKTDERTSHIPLILLTAKASHQDKIEGLGVGADDYMMKPFDPDELCARVKNLIEQRKRIHEHFRNEGIFDLESAPVTPVDKKFMQKVLHIIMDHIAEPSLNVASLAGMAAVSRSVLHRKIVALTGEPPVDLIKRIRLTRAAELLQRNAGNISEIALDVGFTNPAHFSDSFKKQFGVPPSRYPHNPTDS